MFRRIAGPLLAFVLALSGGLAWAAPAQAVDRECPDGFVCFWVDEFRNGAKGKFEGNNPRWGDYRQGSCGNETWDNCASSIINKGRTCTVRVYSGPNYGGGSMDIQRGQYMDNLGFRTEGLGWNQNWGDRISSNKWIC
ncbi:peptidase inhibitor family I36 protein [Actinoplanes sp. NPDC051859]|uniref:peptidase inhibitor family I36 protein n=1 Tax=Actinoplanes sp. NPDC051859 TaxID=3363909 RepID=UPI0037A73287